MNVLPCRRHERDLREREHRADERGLELDVHAGEATDARRREVDVVGARLQRGRGRRRLRSALDGERLRLEPRDDLLLERAVVAHRRSRVRSLGEDRARVDVAHDDAGMRLDRLVGIRALEEHRRRRGVLARVVAGLPAVVHQIALDGAEGRFLGRERVALVVRVVRIVRIRPGCSAAGGPAAARATTIVRASPPRRHTRRRARTRSPSRFRPTAHGYGNPS